MQPKTFQAQFDRELHPARAECIAEGLTDRRFTA